jgi:uncharacterized damage-inducible protein DinB
LATAPFRSAEVATFWRFIVNSLDRMLAVAQSLDADGLHWRPAAGANSVAVLVRHTLGNAEENLLMVLCGQSFSRLRDDEFLDHSVSAADLVTAWHEVRPRLEAALATVEADEMTRLRPHPRRGELSGRDVLIVVARHAAEHLGQAELTRDLYLWRAGHPAIDEVANPTL